MLNLASRWSGLGVEVGLNFKLSIFSNSIFCNKQQNWHPIDFCSGSLLSFLSFAFLKWNKNFLLYCWGSIWAENPPVIYMESIMILTKVTAGRIPALSSYFGNRNFGQTGKGNYGIPEINDMFVLGNLWPILRSSLVGCKVISDLATPPLWIWSFDPGTSSSEIDPTSRHNFINLFGDHPRNPPPLSLRNGTGSIEHSSAHLIKP